TQYSLNLARELERIKQLSGFHTCLAVRTESNLARLIQPFARTLGIERQWQNRLLANVPRRKLHCYPWLEIETMWRLRNANGCGRKTLQQRNDRFQQNIPKNALAAADVVIGFDTSSRLLARRARARGAKFILDRSIGHPLSFDLV